MLEIQGAVQAAGLHQGAEGGVDGPLAASGRIFRMDLGELDDFLTDWQLQMQDTTHGRASCKRRT